jgi:hypothetical protein
MRHERLLPLALRLHLFPHLPQVQLPEFFAQRRVLLLQLRELVQQFLHAVEVL